MTAQQHADLQPRGFRADEVHPRLIWQLARPDVSTSERTTLMVMFLRLQTRPWLCTATQIEIAYTLGVDDRIVRRHVAALREKGVVIQTRDWDPHRHRVTTCYLLPESPPLLALPDDP